MPLQRSILVLFCLAALLSAVSAVSISAESQVTAGSPWSFNVAYSLSSGNDLKVSLDGAVIFELFEHNGQVFVNDSAKSPKVLNYSNSSGNLFISFSGLSEGTHKVSVQILSGSTVVEETSADVEFFMPLSASERDALVARISTLESTISGQNSQITSLQSDVEGKQATIDSLESSNESLSSQVNELNGQVSSLEASDAAKSEEISQLKYDLNELVSAREKERQSILGGMFAAGSNDFVFTGIIALIAVVIIVGFVVFKSNGGSIYSGGKNFNKKLSDGELDSMSKEGPFGGKFAFALGGFSKRSAEAETRITSKPEKKFSYGDLLKK